MKPYDLIALGGGPAGNSAAQQAALRGARTCVVEQNALGGTCLNVGCMPTKGMLAGSELCHAARRAGEFGIALGEPSVDGRAFMARIHRLLDEFREEARSSAESMDGLDIVTGRGRLLDSHTVEVVSPQGATQQLHAGAIAIATGSRPTRPEVFPWDSQWVWTSDEAVTAEDLPGPVLLIIGSGPLGCEFATCYAELGLTVTLVEREDRLLPQLDPLAGQAARALLEERQVTVRTGTTVSQMTVGSSGLETTLDSGQVVRSDHALVAVGRRMNLEGLGLDEAGVNYEETIPVDEACRTNVEHIYAGGDVAEARNHSHLAERMGIVIGDQVTGCKTTDDRSVVPVGVYTHPEIATVGLAEADARAQGLDVRTEEYRYAESSTAKLYGRTLGRCRLVIENQTQRIRGGLWIGPHAVDMIHECALAIRHGLTMEDIFRTIHAHPSFQQAMHVISESYCTDRLGCGPCEE